MKDLRGTCFCVSHDLLPQNGHLLGRLPLPDVHPRPHCMQSWLAGGVFQHLDPQPGHLTGLPFWEFHL